MPTPQTIPLVVLPQPTEAPGAAANADDEALALMQHLLRFGYLRAARRQGDGSWRIRVRDTSPLLAVPDAHAALDYAVVMLSLFHGYGFEPPAVVA
ncbi:hypothetical protein SAMN05414137_10236 [Streptacidiphilus jiangxiensis]|uniref:Uncharacterized protein n=2 Tax=Streptacidiphilus jiangxiensis TaxID=235985 RepID=A0A1H7H186_STRJI|nr:hypothetical protein SAMN05414137_10236 [Streptacidiphilus jiangxiensis]